MRFLLAALLFALVPLLLSGMIARWVMEGQPQSLGEYAAARHWPKD